MLVALCRIPKVAVSVACGLLLGLLMGQDASGQLLLPSESSMPVYVSMYMPAVTYTVTIQMPYHVFRSCALTCLTLGTAGLGNDTGLLLILSIHLISGHQVCSLA